MDNLPLKTFLQSVLTLPQTATLAEVFQIVSAEGSGSLAVVNSQNHPLGLVNLLNLLTYLLPSDQGGATRSLTSPENLTLQQLIQKDPIFLQPLVILSAEQTLNQCWSSLRVVPPYSSAIALVTVRGEFLGLLDMASLLNYLTNSLLSGPNSPCLLPNQLQPTHVTNLPDTAPLVASSSMPVSSELLQSLSHIIDQLPLPIMVQLGSGQVLVQNQAWHSQVGKFQDPKLIQRSAALFLETNEAGQGSASSSASFTEQRHCSQPEGTDPAELDPLTMEEQAVCQLGEDSNTCWCVCPMDDGEERVWQFTKIPLGPTTGLGWLHQIDRVMNSAQGADGIGSSGTQPFRLGDMAAHMMELADFMTPHYFDQTQDAVLWLILAQDHTEQQQTARELAARNADLVQLNRLKDEFLACVSHELKTPLTAILGLSSLLGETVLGSLNERQARYVQLIHQSGRQLVTIVNDILDLTRMETGQLELVLEPVEIQAVCEVAYQQAKRDYLADEAGQSTLDHESFSRFEHGQPVTTLVGNKSFTLEIESGLDYIVADSLRLRQMLLHLLSNALKFTPDGNQLGLKVSRWQGWIAFNVWDTGIGIPADKQHLIFQKFQQLESPLTRRFEGTGMGLVLTQRLARLHGGEVTFISRESKGSQFTLLLPPSPPSEGRLAGQEDEFNVTEPPESLPEPVRLSIVAAHQHLKPAQLSDRLVLLVEAAPSAIEELTDQIERLGFWVAIARSGTEAVEKVRRLQPCVIFLNPHLPLLSGWDVLTLLKADPDTRHIPIVVMAATPNQSKTLSRQADEFLPMPLQPGNLETILTTLTQRSPNPETTILQTRQLTILLLSRSWAERELEQHRTTPEVVSSTNETLNETLMRIDEIINLLQAHHHRVIEVDDIDQAEFLAKVWKPDILLLNDLSVEPIQDMQTLRDCEHLVNLPIVTLTQTATQAVNQVGGLTVFPCLAPPTAKLISAPGQPAVSALLQVMQVAAGMSWKPLILIIDLFNLSDWVKKSGRYNNPSHGHPSNAGHYATAGRDEVNPSSSGKSMGTIGDDWSRALTQYLHTAGFRSVIVQSWAETLHLLQHQRVDLLLLYLNNQFRLSSNYPDNLIWADNSLASLQNMARRPPALVMDHRSKPYLAERGERRSTNGGITIDHLELENSLTKQLQRIATQILPSSSAMTTLLEAIQTALGGRSVE